VECREVIVLDTHAWVWWAATPARLSLAARRAIDAADEIGVSVISCWEVAMAVAKGRLAFDRDPLAWLREAIRQPRVEMVTISAEIAVLSTTLAGFHGDPADRLIVASALDRAAPLVTMDRSIRRWKGVSTVW
jgi:PIN domain nuclease of toxin-antitoxin system